MAKLRLGHGCLSNQNQALRYDLDEEQKKLITAALRADKNFEYSDEQKIQKTLVQFNCIACHDRAGLGGIHPSKNQYFTGSSLS